MARYEPDYVRSGSSSYSKVAQLIDRIEEMKVLRETADRAVSDQGQLLFLRGEAGIGKTRLTRELQAYACTRGMLTLYGRCPALFRMNGTSPYALWKEIIRDYLEHCTPEQLQRVVGYYPGEIYKLVPEIRQKLITFSESPPLSPEMERDRLFEAVSQFITNISRTAPLMIVFDDLQWADPSSLLLLNYLARGIYRENLLLIGAYRDSDVQEDHPLTPIIAELNRTRLLQSIQLKRMSKDETAQLIKQILNQTEVPKDFCGRVYEKTLGNPFFVEEVIKSLKEEGIIYREEDKYRIRAIAEIEFPKTVKDVLKARLSRLDEESQNTLRMAALIGNDFTLEALRAVTGMEESRLLELTEKIAETGLFKCRVSYGEDHVSFADVLVRDAIYEEISPLKRKRLHGIVGLALEKAYAGKIDEHFGEMASHFLESGDKDKALGYYLRAGEKAAKVYANNEAASYYQSALKLLEEKGRSLQERIRVLEMLGDIEELIGDYDASLKHRNEALHLLDQSEDKERTARIYRKISFVLWMRRGETEKAKECQKKAQELLESRPHSIELVGLQLDIADLLWHSGDPVNAYTLTEKALEKAEKLNDNEMKARLYQFKGKLHSFRGESQKAFDYSEKALKIALDNGYIETALEALRILGRRQTRIETATGVLGKESRMEYYQRGYEMAKRVGALSAQSWIGSDMAIEYANGGKMELALLLGEEAVALDRKTNNLHNLPHSLTSLGAVLMARGELAEAEKCINEALQEAAKTNNKPVIGMGLVYLSNLNGILGQYAKQMELSQKAFELLKPIIPPQGRVWVLAGYIMGAIQLGELEKAEQTINKLQETAREQGAQGLYNVLGDFRAGLMFAQKKWDEAIAHFESRIKEYGVGAGIEYVGEFQIARYVLALYVKAYLERNREGDKQKALKLLNLALEIYQRLGNRREIERTRAMISYVQTGKELPVEPPSPVATGYPPLDKLLDGGIPSGSSVALLSPPCSEKNSIVRGFLETGARNGEPAFHVTADPNIALTSTLSSNLVLFICNPQAETLVTSSPSINILKGLDNLTSINIALTQATRKLSKTPRRICIDVVSDVLLQHGVVTTRKWLTELLTQLRGTGFTVLAAINPLMHPPEQLYATLGLFEGEINIREAETDKGLARFMRVKRLSSGKYLKNEIMMAEE